MVVDAGACGDMALSELQWWVDRAERRGLLKRKD